MILLDDFHVDVALRMNRKCRYSTVHVFFLICPSRPSIALCGPINLTPIVPPGTLGTFACSSFVPNISFERRNAHSLGNEVQRTQPPHLTHTFHANACILLHEWQGVFRAILASHTQRDATRSTPPAPGMFGPTRGRPTQQLYVIQVLYPHHRQSSSPLAISGCLTPLPVANDMYFPNLTQRLTLTALPLASHDCDVLTGGYPRSMRPSARSVRGRMG